VRAALAVTLAALAALALGCGVSSRGGGTTAPAPPPAPQGWPQGHAAPMQITSELTLAVPLEFERTAIDDAAPPPGAATPAAAAPGTAAPGSAHGEVHFDFFLPDFTGYTLGNYRRESDPNKVEVLYLHAGNSHEADPDAPGEYPPNMLKRQLGELLDARRSREQYGLRCYPGRLLTNRLTCFGRRGSERGEYIMLTALLPPYAADAGYPAFEARYFSRRYGGVRIEWRAHMSQLARWRRIDAQVWRFIDAWRVAPAR